MYYLQVRQQNIPALSALTTLFLLFLFFFGVPHSAYALSVSVRIGDQHTEVIGGDRLYFDVEIKYPENPRRKDLRIEYQIIENSTVIANEKVLRAVETQASFLDYIVIPKGAKGGLHDLNVIITDYEGLNKDVSASFKVLKGIDQIKIYFFIILGTIFLVAILVIIQIRVAKRRV